MQKQLSENVFIDERRPVLLCDGKLCLRAIQDLFNLTTVEMMYGMCRRIELPLPNGVMLVCLFYCQTKDGLGSPLCLIAHKINDVVTEYRVNQWKPLGGNSLVFLGRSLAACSSGNLVRWASSF